MLLCVIIIIIFFQGTVTLSRKMVRKVLESAGYTLWSHAVEFQQFPKYSVKVVNVPRTRKIFFGQTLQIDGFLYKHMGIHIVSYL